MAGLKSSLKMGVAMPPLVSLAGLSPKQGGGVQLIGGIAIGAAGSGIFSPFKLAAGDDFDAAPTRWHGANLTGKYGHSTPSYGFRGTNASQDNMMYIDPAFRGARSQSQTELGYDGVSIANSIATLTASVPAAGLLPFLPTTYTGGRGDGGNRPKLISGALKTAPYFMLSAKADWALECRVRFPAGVARGYWPSFWTSTLFWPDFGEIDVVEGIKDASGNLTSKMNVIVSASDGGGAAAETVSQPAYAANQWINVAFVKSGGTVYFYDDAVTPGTLALRGSTTTRVSRLRGAHDVRIDLAVAEWWDSSTFNSGDWPKTVEFDWWRAWTPIAGGDNSALQILSPIDVAPGGSWATTLPSTLSLFGSGAGLEQVSAAWDNFDAPGMPTRNSTTKLPTSMTVDLGTRAVTGTVPTTEGGCMPLLLTYAYDDGTPAKRAMLPYRVAPAEQASMFANPSASYGEAFSRTIAYVDFHSGNLGPHTYHVTKTGGAWLTISGNDTGQVTLSGTAPSTDDSVALTVTCTNSVGQTTTINRTVTVAAAAFDPIAWSSAIDWWDANDNTKVFSDAAATTPAVAGSTVAGAWVGSKTGATFANSDAATTPDYVTDANGKKAVKFSRASVDKLINSTAALVTNVTGDDNAYAIVMAVKRGTPDVSVTPIAFSRDDGTSTNDYIRHYLSGSDAVGITRVSNGTQTNIASGTEVVPANNWYVVSWVFSGTTLTVRVNGVAVLSGGALNSNAITISKLILGAFFTNVTDAYDSATAFDGAIGEFGLLQSILSSDATLAQAESYLMTKWTN
ncbi:LamG-like jellyroll fold domain-containing protein [Rhizobium esperanzae]|uniref:GH16 domain-containing protein n=1 Tax=Rhizobium esperanzae TaxID=1967781 RepID=A0A7W6R1Q6_9HYPH|nr:LamG-like jellyroll fold domain-containing protein [Rhizobium esperanzae]MBB4235026.1 hypothetical protein [Rhizobium esperanzae]